MKRFILIFAWAVSLAAFGQSASSKKAYERIKDEAFNRSQVMHTLSHLTEVIGPRLPASRALKRANDWTRAQLEEWGLKNARLEPCGYFPLGGWSLKRFSAQIIEPRCIPLNAYPKAWSAGTPGAREAPIVWIDATNLEGLQRYRGKLKGAAVLYGPLQNVGTGLEPLAKRKTGADLRDLTEVPITKGSPEKEQASAEKAPTVSTVDRIQFFAEEGATLAIEPSAHGDGGTLFVEGVEPTKFLAEKMEKGQPFTISDLSSNLPQLVLAKEQFNHLVRLIQNGASLKIATEISVEFEGMEGVCYNTLAEIPGTDLADQVVLLGAHLDSWHSATGSTDNGAGVAVVMEAARILRSVGVKPRRTIQIALWSNEEVDRMGSHSHVEKQFGTPAKRSAEQQRNYDRFSAYYNLDYGSGKIRGVYLQENEALRPIFREWLQRFAELGFDTLSFKGVYGSDQASFDGAGLPGISFIQDDLDYESRTRHTNQDWLERVQVEDLKQLVTVLATFAYNIAQRDELLPRKAARSR